MTSGNLLFFVCGGGGGAEREMRENFPGFVAMIGGEHRDSARGSRGRRVTWIRPHCCGSHDDFLQSATTLRVLSISDASVAMVTTC